MKVAFDLFYYPQAVMEILYKNGNDRYIYFRKYTEAQSVLSQILDSRGQKQVRNILIDDKNKTILLDPLEIIHCEIKRYGVFGIII